MLVPWYIVGLLCMQLFGSADMSLFIVLFESTLLAIFTLYLFNCKVRRGAYGQYLLCFFTIIGAFSMVWGLGVIYHTTGSLHTSVCGPSWVQHAKQCYRRMPDFRVSDENPCLSLSPLANGSPCGGVYRHEHRTSRGLS